jgi:phosphoribosylformylglycinamidine synthase PurS subunit
MSGSPTSRSIAGSGTVERRSQLRVRVLIRPKEGILDPQGQAVERALPALGYEGVSNVHVGRLVELELPDGSPSEVGARVEEMCERLLANPLIESYEVEPLDG